MWKERIDMIGIWNWFKEINFSCMLGIHKWERSSYMFDINKAFRKTFPNETRYIPTEERIVSHFWWECNRCGKKQRDYNGEMVEW